MDNFDRILDQVLLERAPVQPRQGLEKRILSRIAAEKRRPWFLLAGALAAGIGVVCSQIPAPVHTSPVPYQRLVSYQSGMVDSPKPVQRHRVRRRKPVPVLTPEEQALRYLATQEPALAQELFRNIPHGEPEPLQITALKIEPLPD